jgi:lysyl-tRNA synthetase class 2
MPSSVIRDFAYEPAECRLDILFVSGRCYSYYDVPSEVARAMGRASSKGEYFNRHIRDHYRFTRTRGKSGLPMMSGPS